MNFDIRIPFLYLPKSLVEGSQEVFDTWCNLFIDTVMTTGSNYKTFKFSVARDTMKSGEIMKVNSQIQLLLWTLPESAIEEGVASVWTLLDLRPFVIQHSLELACLTHCYVVVDDLGTIGRAEWKPKFCSYLAKAILRGFQVRFKFGVHSFDPITLFCEDGCFGKREKQGLSAGSRGEVQRGFYVR